MGTDRMKLNALEVRKPAVPKPTPRDPSFRARMAHMWKQVVSRVRTQHEATKRVSLKQKVRLGIGM
jgi:hypothetical protein